MSASLGYKAARKACDLVIRFLGFDRASPLACLFLQRAVPVHEVEGPAFKIRFYCPNELTKDRALTLLTREPETIEWIDSFSPGDVLFDVGANVGLYSLYAAKRGARVLAFEPESQNYAVLNWNVYLNDLSDSVSCLNIALSDEDKFDFLHLQTFSAGTAHVNFGAATDWQHRDFKAAFKQGVVSFSLDSFLAFPSRDGLFPNHIKIDVDGIEMKILRGARRTLQDPRLKSLSLEINEALPEHRQMPDFLRSLGLLFAHKKQAPHCGSGDLKDTYNYVFRRP